jgi:hypothetical protein
MPRIRRRLFATSFSAQLTMYAAKVPPTTISMRERENARAERSIRGPILAPTVGSTDENARGAAV